MRLSRWRDDHVEGRRWALGAVMSVRSTYDRCEECRVHDGYVWTYVPRGTEHRGDVRLSWCHEHHRENMIEV